MHRHPSAALLAATLLGCTPAAMQPDAPLPLALARGQVSQSTVPTHLAITGDAFFVLAATTPPRSLDDLVFTREGAFHLEFRSGDLPDTGTYRLLNPDGLAVMAWRTPVDVNVRPFGTSPEESRGADLTAFQTVVTDGPRPPMSVDFGPLELDHTPNPDLANQVSFDARGITRAAGGAPHDLAGRELNLHVVLASFPKPEGLRHEGGGYLRWTPAAGPINVGTAADGRPDHVVGKATTLTPGALEQLPLLTPSRYDRERYADALDPTVTLPGDVRPLQRRGDVLRPVVLGGLARGAIVDVWTDAAGQARAVVLDRDDRPDAGLDAFTTGWL